MSHGAVTPVKSQGQCGSCWSFSATGALEGALFVSEGRLVSLSEQQLVSCSTQYNHGCGGGLPDFAFSFATSAPLCTEQEYPYVSGNGANPGCQRSCRGAVQASSHVDVPRGDETALKAAVANQPVSIALYAAPGSPLQLYKSGVLDPPSCSSQLDHAVLIVVYGFDAASGLQYWKVKNSWGSWWGEGGYVRIVRGKNMCGLANEASYPTGVHSTGGPTPKPTPGPTPIVRSPPPPPTPTPTPGACIDQNAYCQSWAATGECARNPNYMDHFCVKACGLCTHPPPPPPSPPPPQAGCADKQANCASWAAAGYCSQDANFMLLQCPVSCSACPPAPTPGPAPPSPTPSSKPWECGGQTHFVHTTLPHSCANCVTSLQCEEGWYCCPYMKKCIKAGVSCFEPIADCKPSCYDSADPTTCSCSNPDFPNNWVTCPA